MRPCVLYGRTSYHSIFCNRPIPISIAAVPQAVSTPNLPGSETTLLSLSWCISYIYGFITLVDKQSNSTLESESVASVTMLNNALAGRNRSASDVSRFRLSSVQLRNHEVGYFDPLLWAVRVMICVKCSVVLCLKNRKYGGVSSLMGEQVLKRIVKELSSAKYFSVTVDSTPYILYVDQVTCVLRCVLPDRPVEHFVGFLNMVNHNRA